MTGFIEELKRRNVLRAAAFYAGGGWLIVQIATQVFPFFDIPNWAVRLVVVAVVAGFPFTLVISWFYEFTPSGFKWDPGDKDAARVGARRPARLAFALLCAASLTVAVLIAARLTKHESAAPPSAIASVAVLPFQNLSSNGENAYFAVGIQQEVLTRLSKIGLLRVIAPSSTARYASMPDDPDRIAKELSVDHLLEGSVQRQGDDVRINVQLFRTNPSASVWAETYDRKLIDIFGVESEVARSVADSLKTTLTGQERQALDVIPTSKPEAYDQYLRGLAYDLRSFEPANLRRASDAFRTAVTLDPRFALAWARLARVDASLGYQGADVENRPCERAADEAGKALELQPELGEARLAEGAYLYLCRSNLDQAIAALQQARIAMPGNAEVLETMGSVEHRRGAWSEAVEYLRQALEVDPRNTRLLGTYALTLAQMRRFPEARALAERALEITPDDPAKLAIQIYTLQAQGRLDEAGKLLESAVGHQQEVDVYDYQILQLLYLKRYPEAVDRLKQSLRQDLTAIGEGAGDFYYMLGLAQRENGDADDARNTFAAGRAFLAQYRGTSQASDTDVYLHTLLCVLAVGQGIDPDQDSECLFTAKAGAAGGPYSASAREALARAYALNGKVEAAVALLPDLLQTP